MIDKSKIKFNRNVIDITRVLRDNKKKRDKKFRELEQTLDTCLYNFKLNEEFEDSLRKKFHDFYEKYPYYKIRPVIAQMRSFYENNYSKGIECLEKEVIWQVLSDMRRYSS